jgi:hypothetical protein
LTAENEPDRHAPDADPWIIDGMLPIAVAHAEAAAKAAGVTIGEWLSQIIAEQTPATEEKTPETPSGGGPKP